MKILWFTWKDRENPQAGGAELINEELAKRLAQDGHEVIFIVCGIPGCAAEGTKDGYKIIRQGNRLSVYWKAQRYYHNHLRDWADLIIEEINTIPFFTQIYAKKEKRVLLIYQLCRPIWFFQMVFPLSLIGYLLEPLYLYAMRNNFCITESNSTCEDLIRFGFRKDRISIFPVGIEIEPIKKLEDSVKFNEPTILSIGALRSMKRTIHQIKAFNLAKTQIPNLKLKIAGDGNNGYKRKVMKYLSKSHYHNDIEYLGRIDLQQKHELMLKSHILTVTSVKEGWGLIVTEAASQGTPAIVYDVDGLRDSVRDGFSGLICKKNNPRYLAAGIVELLRDTTRYETMRYNAWQMSKEHSFAECYNVFSKILEVRQSP